MEGGKEEARGGWEGGNKGRGNEGGREWGREEAREEAIRLCRESVSRGREG